MKTEDLMYQTTDMFDTLSVLIRPIPHKSSEESELIIVETVTIALNESCALLKQIRQVQSPDRKIAERLLLVKLAELMEKALEYVLSLSEAQPETIHNIQTFLLQAKKNSERTSLQIRELHTTSGG